MPNSELTSEPAEESLERGDAELAGAADFAGAASSADSVTGSEPTSPRSTPNSLIVCCVDAVSDFAPDRAVFSAFALRSLPAPEPLGIVLPSSLDPLADEVSEVSAGLTEDCGGFGADFAVSAARLVGACR